MADTLALLWRQYRFERHLFWRNPSAAFFNFLLPLIFLALFGAIVSGNRHELDIIVPGIAGMSVMSTTFTALAYNLTFLREQGVLKRMRGTPLPSGVYLGGLALNAVTNAAIQIGIVVLAGRLFFGLGWPPDGVAARAVRGRRRDLLRGARRRALARDPELRVGAGGRQRRVRAGDPDLRRLLRRQARPELPARHRAGAAARPPDRRARAAAWSRTTASISEPPDRAVR